MEDSSQHIADLCIVAIVIYATSLHEMAHAYVATWLGDPTPGRAGRLTWNPLPHLNPPMTAIVAPILFYLTSHSLFCLATTPIDPTRFRRPLRDHALVAVAGPLMNLLMMSVLVGICWIPGVINYDPANLTTAILPWAAFWNLVLAVFNLCPVPPLDGYWICRGLLPLRIRREIDQLARHQGSLFVIMIFGVIFFRYMKVHIPLYIFIRSIMPPGFHFV
jgi:Zn-dependent protease